MERKTGFNLKLAAALLTVILLATAYLTTVENNKNTGGLSLDVNVSLSQSFDNLSDYCMHTEYNVSACQQITDQRSEDT